MAGEIKAWNRLKGLSQADFTAGITKVYVMANHTHPFPEGNGRSTQTLLSQLAREAGYELRFSNVDKRSWDMAAARSMPQVNAREPLLAMLARPAGRRQAHTRGIRSHRRATGANSSDRPRAVAGSQASGEMLGACTELLRNCRSAAPGTGHFPSYDRPRNHPASDRSQG